jgi:hypothetical protein
VNLQLIREACLALNMAEPISIEPDGAVWTGPDDKRVYADMAPILKKAEAILKDREKAEESVRDKLSNLGLTAAEIAVLFRA